MAKNRGMGCQIRSGHHNFSCLEAKQIRDLRVNSSAVVDEAVVADEAGTHRDTRGIQIFEIAFATETEGRAGMDQVGDEEVEASLFGLIMPDGTAPCLVMRRSGPSVRGYSNFSEPSSVVIAVMVVISIIPIAFGVPAVVMFIPPPMDLGPATLPLCAQLPASGFGLVALEAMPLNGYVQLVVRSSNAALAIVFVGAHNRHCGKHQKARQNSCR
jgi:hypothetical protein